MSCNGFDSRDPNSLPRVDGWEAGLGSYDLRGRRAVITSEPRRRASSTPKSSNARVQAGEALAREAGLELVDVPVKLPELGLEWALAGLAEIRARSRRPLSRLRRRPHAADRVRPEDVAKGCTTSRAAPASKRMRTAMNEAMAEIFDQVDFVIAASNPDVAFGAKGPMPTRVNDVETGPGNNGALTIPSNIYGNPAISIPAGTVRGLPVGLQVLAPHYREAWLLDLARLVERGEPWPTVAPGAPL